MTPVASKKPTKRGRMMGQRSKRCQEFTSLLENARRRHPNRFV